MFSPPPLLCLSHLSISLFICLSTYVVVVFVCKELLLSYTHILVADRGAFVCITLIKLPEKKYLLDKMLRRDIDSSEDLRENCPYIK